MNGFGLFLFLLGSLVPAAATAAGSESGEHPGFVRIDHPEQYTRVAAVSDVHGMLDSLLKVLQGAKLIGPKREWTGGKTLLLVVGDSIDKGPDSLGVLDLWISLTPQAAAQGGRIIHLLGNHEQTFLDDPKNKKAKEFRAELKEKGIPKKAWEDLSLPRTRFLRTQPVYAQVGLWAFFHSGYFPEEGWDRAQARADAVIRKGAYDDAFLTSDESPLEAREWWKHKKERKRAEKRMEEAGIAGVVFGHQPGALGCRNTICAGDRGRLIKIDTGMLDRGPADGPGAVLIFSEPGELTGKNFPHVFSVGADGKMNPIPPESD